MKKRLLKKITVSVVCGIMLVLPLVSFAADGFITPWTSTYNFDKASLSVEKAENYTSNWITGYNFVGVNAGATAVVRDGYVKDETMVYDGVDKTEGNKYIYYNSVGLRNKDNKIMSPGSLYINYSNYSDEKFTATKANGGICHGRVKYEFDIRIGELEAVADYDTGTGVYIYGYNASAEADSGKLVELVNLPFKHSESQKSYYTSYTEVGAEKATSPGFALNEWYHYTIDVDVKNGTADIDITCENPSTTIPSSVRQSVSGKINLKTTGIPAFTTVKIVPAKGGATSIDNVSVTKETFVIGEKNISVNDTDNTVTATVQIANDVYADKAVGGAVATTSPKVILATYGEGNELINANFESVEFTDHELPSNATNAQKKEFFTKALDYKTVKVTVPKTDKMFNARVFVWNNMTDMFPYTAAERE